MKLILLDLAAEPWLSLGTHQLWVVLAIVALLLLTGIFFYRRRKNNP